MMRDAMLRVREMAVKELRQLLRDPRTRGMIFVAPIIQLLLFGYAVTTDVRHIPVFVVDQDRTVASRALVDAFAAGDDFRIVGRSDRSADLERALDRGTAEIGLEVPPGFARDLAAGRGTRVQLLVDGSNSNTATIAQGRATLVVQRFGVDAMAARTGITPSPPFELRPRAWYNPELTSRNYNVPAVIGALLMLMCLLLTALGVVREREIGTLEQLIVTPIRAREFVLGKTLPVLGIALIDLVLIVVVAVLWFGVPFRGSTLVLLAAALLFIVTGLATGLLISSISRTQQEAFMAMFLVFLPALILSGLLLPVENMPLLFEWITLFNPLRHFLEIVRAVFLKGTGFVGLWAQFAWLSALAMAIAAAGLMRVRRILA
jgi:ABC-2 type transport system permease protein